MQSRLQQQPLTLRLYAPGDRASLRRIACCRRLDHDYERLPEHSEAMVHWAMIGIMVRRLAPAPGRKPWQPSNSINKI